MTFLPKPFFPRDLRNALERTVASPRVPGWGMSPLLARTTPTPRRTDAPHA